jgi:hypothetical protein
MADSSHVDVFLFVMSNAARAGQLVEGNHQFGCYCFALWTHFLPLGAQHPLPKFFKRGKSFIFLLIKKKSAWLINDKSG